MDTFLCNKSYVIGMCVINNSAIDQIVGILYAFIYLYNGKKSNLSLHFDFLQHSIPLKPLHVLSNEGFFFIVEISLDPVSNYFIV